MEGIIARFLDHLRCVLCQEALRTPYTLHSCQHSFCRTCIMRWIRSEEGVRNGCPTCGGRIIIKNLKRNESLGTILACIQKLHRLRAGLMSEMSSTNVTSSMVETLMNETSSMNNNLMTIPSREKNRSTPRRFVKSVEEKKETPELTARPIRSSRSLIKTPGSAKTPVTELEQLLHIKTPHSITPTRRKAASSASSKSKRGRTTMDKKTSNLKESSNVSQRSASMTRSNKSAYVLLTTGLSEDQKEIINSSYDKIGTERVQLLTHYTPSVTHLISAVNEEGFCPRTVKYMRGILEAKHIVSYDWFLASLTAGSFVPEHPFYLKGDDVVKQATMAVQKSMAAGESANSLFQGLSFYLAGTFASPAPTRADLSMLVKAGGGTLLLRKPKNSNNVWTISQKMTGNDGHLATWNQLLDCISFYSLDPLCKSG